MIVGVTATQRGLVDRQVRVLEEYFQHFRPSKFVHGDCIGGDEDSHDIFLRVFPHTPIITRPCDIENKRAHCIGVTFEYPPEPPLQRNKKIVDEINLLFGLPGEQDEVVRSGTWSTIRYAKRIGKPVIIIYPEAKKQGLLGPVEEEFNMGNLRGR